MNVLKSLRKSYVAISLASLILFVSCEQYESSQDSVDAKFDYSLFNTYKGNMLDINVLNTSRGQQELSRLELNEAILNDINLQLGTNLDYSYDFKSLEITSSQEIINWGLQNELLNNKDVEILNTFINSVLSNDMETALIDLEAAVFQSEELSLFKIEKYETLANTVRLINEENPEMFNSIGQQRSCFGAVIGIVFAFVALILACAATGATGGAVAPGCYWAAANFVRASITLGVEC